MDELRVTRVPFEPVSYVKTLYICVVLREKGMIALSMILPRMKMLENLRFGYHNDVVPDCLVCAFRDHPSLRKIGLLLGMLEPFIPCLLANKRITHIHLVFARFIVDQPVLGELAHLRSLSMDSYGYVGDIIRLIGVGRLEKIMLPSMLASEINEIFSIRSALRRVKINVIDYDVDIDIDAGIRFIQRNHVTELTLSSMVIPGFANYISIERLKKIRSWQTLSLPAPDLLVIHDGHFAVGTLDQAGTCAADV